MDKNVIENLVFSKKSKTELIDETVISLQSLLHETFSGKGSSGLRNEFPTNTSPDELRIKLDNVIVYYESMNSAGLTIEVILDIFIPTTNFELGTFSQIFNENGNLMDQFIIIN